MVKLLLKHIQLGFQEDGRTVKQQSKQPLREKHIIVGKTRKKEVHPLDSEKNLK